MAPTPIPPAGSAAYWTAQREAFALIAAWRATDDPWTARDRLRDVAAHGFASGVMTAQGHDLTVLLAEADTDCGDPDDVDDEDHEDECGPDAPPRGDDWCPRGCQPLFGMECGICGYEGRGVWLSCTAAVAEYCLHCRARTYQGHDGICELCSRDAENPDAPVASSAATAAVAEPSMEER